MRLFPYPKRRKVKKKLLSNTAGNSIGVTRNSVAGNPLTMYNVSTGNVIQQFSQSSIANLVTNGDFSNGTTGWSADSGVTFTVENGIAKVVSTSGYTSIFTTGMNLTVGRKIYFRAIYKCNNEVQLGTGNTEIGTVPSSSDYASYSKIVTMTSGAYLTLKSKVAGTIYFDNIMIVDLTATFGDNNIPTQAWCDANIPFFTGTTTIQGLNPLVTHGDFGYVGGTEDTYTFDMGIKVAGDVVNCPLKISHCYNSVLQNPDSVAWSTYAETTQAEIDKLKSNDGISFNPNNSVSGNTAQIKLELDLTPLCNQKYGGSNSAMKTDYKTTSNFDIHAKGSGANASVAIDGVIYYAWNGTSWVNLGSNLTNAITKVNCVLNNSNYIQSTNKVFILIASQYPSDGTIPSSVSLDFAQIKITTNRVADTVTAKQVYLPKYWCMVGSFSPNFDSNKNTENDRIFSFYIDTNNKWSFLRNSTDFVFVKTKNGTSSTLTRLLTFSKNQLYRFAVGQSASGMFMVLLKNNGTIEKVTNTDVTELKGLSLLQMLNQNGIEQGDMFSDIFGLYDLQALGKPNSFTDAEYEGILRGRTDKKNLFDKSKMLTDRYINSSGNIATLANYYASDYISVKSSTSYTVSKGANNSSVNAWYDSNKVFISNFTSSATSATVTSPVNAKYARITTITPNECMLEESSTATAYEPYLENPLGIQQKNLFDINAVQLHANATRSGGMITLNATVGWQGSTITIPVLPNNVYEMKYTLTGSGAYLLPSQKYNNVTLKADWSVTENGSYTKTIITQPNCNKLIFELGGNTTGTFTFSNISLRLKM